MEFNYNISEEAYLQFNDYYAKNSETVKKSLMIQRITVPIMYLVMAVFLSFVLDMPVLFLMIPFFILGVLWAVFLSCLFLSPDPAQCPEDGSRRER